MTLSYASIPDPNQLSELASLHTQLASTLTLEIDHTQTGIKNLERAASVTISGVRDRLERVNGLCRQAEGLFDNYTMIKAV